jgi:hypothetical protein
MPQNLVVCYLHKLTKGMFVLTEPIDTSNDANWKLTESNTYELFKR